MSMPEPPIDRLAVTIAYANQARQLIDVLNEHRFPATIVDAQGGFLQEAMVTLVAGMPRHRVPLFMSLVRKTCPEQTRFMPIGIEYPSPADTHVVEVRSGGATVFVVPVDEFLQV